MFVICRYIFTLKTSDEALKYGDTNSHHPDLEDGARPPNLDRKPIRPTTQSYVDMDDTAHRQQAVAQCTSAEPRDGKISSLIIDQLDSWQ